ncbi:NF-kappa-B inhibitor delta [Latimeria chalumnae]|uniref:NF-kappa-B inhibitor delta n=1 Tax=Latimeria chalumnae TaxID=7897 RepID=UPI00313F2B1A
MLEEKRKRENQRSCSVASTAVPTPAIQAIQADTSAFSDLTGEALTPYPSLLSSWSPDISQHTMPSEHHHSFLPQPHSFQVTGTFYNTVNEMETSSASGFGPHHHARDGLYSSAMNHPDLYMAAATSSAGPASSGLFVASQNPVDLWTQPTVSSSCVLPDPGGTIYPLPSPSALEIDDPELNIARTTVASMDVIQLLHEDQDGDTILHIYAAKGLRKYAFAAAERFRDFGRLDAKEHKGKSPLLVAVTANQPAIVWDLIKFGADVNLSDQKGQTALHLATTYGFPGVIEAIISSGVPVIVEARNFEGFTPLHCAVISHNSRMQWLPAPGHAHPHMLPLANEKLRCIQLLLSMGANLTSQDFKSAKTVLHMAVQEGNLMLVKFFLELSYHDLHKFINMKAHGNTALHMAAGLHNCSYQDRIIQLLLSHGADPGIRNLENDQAVHLLQSGAKGEQGQPCYQGECSRTLVLEHSGGYRF